MAISANFDPPVLDEVVTGRDLVELLYGKQTDERAYRKARRKLYRLIDANPDFPVFRLGARQYAARPAAVRAWLAERERAGRDNKHRAIRKE